MTENEMPYVDGKPIFQQEKEHKWTLWLAKNGKYYSGEPMWGIRGGDGYLPAFRMSDLIGYTFKVNLPEAWSHGMKVKIVAADDYSSDLQGIVQGENEVRRVQFTHLAPVSWRLKRASDAGRQRLFASMSKQSKTDTPFGLGSFK